MQEVRYLNEGLMRSVKSKHQIDDFANRLPGYQFVFQPAMTYLTLSPPYAHTDEGLAIFSKFPILETSYERLTRNFSDPQDEHQRICLRALINTTSGPLNFFVTHMSLSEVARRRNVVEIWDFVSKYNEKIPQVLVGDLNEEPDSNTLDFLLGKIELSATTGDFKDAWQLLHGESKDGWTFTTLSDQPKKRIDFVLLRGLLDLYDIRVIENDPQKNGNDVPSDHRGLVATFHA